jgi:hypothetical protein
MGRVLHKGISNWSPHKGKEGSQGDTRDWKIEQTGKPSSGIIVSITVNLGNDKDDEKVEEKQPLNVDDKALAIGLDVGVHSKAHHYPAHSQDLQSCRI